MNVRPHCTSENCLDNLLPFPISFYEFGVDEKAAYVEHVCSVLRESRSGPECSQLPFKYFDDVIIVASIADLLSEAAFDLMPRSAVPERLIEEQERELYRAGVLCGCPGGCSRQVERVESSVDAEKPAFRSPATLGRGSPEGSCGVTELRSSKVAEARTE